MNARDVIADVILSGPDPEWTLDTEYAVRILAALAADGWRVVKLGWAGGVADGKPTWLITEEAKP